MMAYEMAMRVTSIAEAIAIAALMNVRVTATVIAQVGSAEAVDASRVTLEM